MCQRDTDAPIIESTDVNGFSRPFEFYSSLSEHRANSIQFDLTTAPPFYQTNDMIRPVNGLDAFRRYVESAGDLATPWRVRIFNDAFDVRVSFVECGMKK